MSHPPPCIKEQPLPQHIGTSDAPFPHLDAFRGKEHELGVKHTKRQLLGNFRALLPTTQLGRGFEISYGKFKSSILIPKNSM